MFLQQSTLEGWLLNRIVWAVLDLSEIKVGRVLVDRSSGDFLR
jgi:hypothetical protein